MCHELKTHVKIWLSLIDPMLWKSFNNTEITQKIDGENQSIMDSQGTSSKMVSQICSGSEEKFETKIKKSQEVPLLLRDPIAILLLIISNMPLNLSKRMCSFKLSYI